MISYCTPSSTKTPWHFIPVRCFGSSVRIADAVRRLRFFMQDADDDASLRQRCSMCGRSLLSLVRIDAWPRQPPILFGSFSVENQVHDNVLEVESDTKQVMQMIVCVFHIQSPCGQLHLRESEKTPLY